MIHEKAEKGQYLSATELSDLFRERYQHYWGPAMETDTDEGLSWARVHHLTTYNFYVYQYSTGFAAAQALSELIVKNGQSAVDKYLDFLSSGSSDTPINVLKKAGVDVLGISTDKPEKLSRFAEKELLNFTLLSDEDHQVCEQFGVWGEKSFMGKTYDGIHRISFLIDADGKIEHVFDDFKTSNHHDVVLNWLKENA
ncbi:hypothetical protein SDC9_171246 [bioreactor metagenome]|uniref:Alkyl hydroperoxide reductase subunit C/ Thiol specific antioxidant domain-containing protein n=2 Tax=metagenomes TaxID=408169 RepID=A0A645GJG0_9ZZZZ